jgi:hypothetical protein
MRCQRKKKQNSRHFTFCLNFCCHVFTFPNLTSVSSAAMSSILGAISLQGAHQDACTSLTKMQVRPPCCSTGQQDQGVKLQKTKLTKKSTTTTPSCSMNSLYASIVFSSVIAPPRAKTQCCTCLAFRWMLNFDKRFCWIGSDVTQRAAIGP